MNRTITYHIEKSYQNIYELLKEKKYPHKLVLQLKQNPSQILLNGFPTRLQVELQPNAIVEITINELESSGFVPYSLPLDIVFEDEDFLVINKPARLPVHPSIGHYEDTLANALVYYYRQEPSPFVYRCMNRLDKDTSGLTLIAKNPLSAALMQQQVKSRQLHRTYLAVVEGSLPEEGTINAPIGRAEDSVILRKIDLENGQPAITHYTCLEQKNGLSLASITLETGRTHQIRVHMSSIRHPLPGDFLYNPDNHQIKRQALHSHRLQFTHPSTGEAMDFLAPLPQDMHELFYS